jgi:hypothetical protein
MAKGEVPQGTESRGGRGRWNAHARNTLAAAAMVDGSGTRQEINQPRLLARTKCLLETHCRIGGPGSKQPA